jgi:hypothetical protein
MKKNIVINKVLGAIVAILMVTLFYLTQKSYNQLKISNQDVVDTNNLISGYQNVANDFKNAVIYISTYKNSPSQDYVHTFGKGLWELQFHLLRLKRLVNAQEKVKLDALSKQIDIEEKWLISTNPNDISSYANRDKHIKNIVSIQKYFDSKISQLQHKAITNIKKTESSLYHLNYWVDALIIFTALIMLLGLALIYKQLSKVNYQNSQLKEIAWIQSHMVRAQVANLLGLSRLINMEDPANSDNHLVLEKMIETSEKLDLVVRQINDKIS